jgi:hypothetical protein
MNILKWFFNPEWFTFYMGGGGGAPTQQNVTQTTIPEYAKPYVERMLGKAEAFSETPYQAYGGERVAGFTPMQQQAFQSAANLGPAQQIGQGTQLAGMAGLGSLRAGQNYAEQATNPYAVQAYMSPYIQGALEPQMAEARRQSELMGVQNAGQAVQAGAFGGSRFGIQEAERQRNLGQNLATIYGTGMQNAFQQAQQAQQFGATLGLQGLGQAGQAAATLGQLGQQQFAQQQGAIQAQAAAGAQQQALEQQKLTQQYQDFLTQRGYPQQQLAFMSDILRGIPLGQQTQTQYMAPQSLASQMAQLGMGAYGMYKAFGAEGGEVKEYAEGGIASATPRGMSYSVPPEKLMSMMEKMSNEQLETIGRDANNAVTLGLVQAEMDRRQMMREGQTLARSMPEGTVKDAMMGIDEVPLDERMFADTAVGEYTPEEDTEGYAGGGGIVAFAKGGKSEPDYVQQYAATDVSKPAMSEEELAAATERGIAARQKYIGPDETKGLMDELAKAYGESFSPEAKERQKGLMALKAAAAFAPEAGKPAPTFFGGLAKAGMSVAEDVAAADKAEREAKRLLVSAKLDYAKAKRAEKAGDYDAGQRYSESMYAKIDAAKKAELAKAQALAEGQYKREQMATTLEAARISAGPGYAAANKPTDFRSAQAAFLNKALADFKVKNPGRQPTEQEFATMNQTATESAGNLMKQYAGDINRDKLEQNIQIKARELALKDLDAMPGMNKKFRDAAKEASKEAGKKITTQDMMDAWIERRTQEHATRLSGGKSGAGQGGATEQPTQTQAFQEGQTSKDREGKPIVFRNGQWVYQ